MSFAYDEELPAGYQDADFEQREYEAQAAVSASLRRQGICTHGWGLSRSETHNRSRAEIDEDRQRGDFPDRPTDERIGCQADIPVGMSLCLDCGELVPDPFADR